MRESDDQTGDEDTPVKAKRAILAEPTQAYTMAGGIEPTMAYDMEDDESNDGVKEQEEVYFVIHYNKKLTNHDT